MSTATILKLVGIMYGLALLLSSLAAHAQEVDRPLTIADCPKGYVLGVIDTDQAQPVGRASDYLPPRTGAETVAAQKAEQAAPRQFRTGCVAPQPDNFTDTPNKH